MKVTARSTPNIALIKYWGNRNDELRLPAGDSLSMNLNSPEVEITIEKSDDFAVTSFDRNGKRIELNETGAARFRKHHALTYQYISTLISEIEFPLFNITIDSQIPRSIGVASSSAIFSALAECYSVLVGTYCNTPLQREQISIIARLGSGSAARGVFGGYVALRTNGEADQIAPETHWELHDIIVIPTQEEKKVGSTEGHALAHTSPYFTERISKIPQRMQECTDAILTKDFEKLQRVAEEDCLDMHRVMETSTPPLHYLSDETHRIVKEITNLRKREHLEVLYTMDAGPTVHLLCTDDTRAKVFDFAHAQKGCSVIEAKVGKGSHLV